MRSVVRPAASAAADRRPRQVPTTSRPAASTAASDRPSWFRDRRGSAVRLRLHLSWVLSLPPSSADSLLLTSPSGLSYDRFDGGQKTSRAPRASLARPGAVAVYREQN